MLTMLSILTILTTLAVLTIRIRTNTDRHPRFTMLLACVVPQGEQARRPGWYYATSHAYFLSTLVVVMHHIAIYGVSDDSES